MKGDRFPSETIVSTDPVTGVRITQLTNHRGHSHHLYFTNSGWYAGGRKLLIGSDRFNRTDLFSVEVEGGRITQLTDGREAPGAIVALSACLSPAGTGAVETYFWSGRELLAMDLLSLRQRILYRLPEGWLSGTLSCTSDGGFLCVAVSEDLERAGGSRRNARSGYQGYREHFLARPQSRVMLISVRDGTAQVLHEEQTWITHANASPTQGRLATFCHEGPWHEVEQRIWGIDLESGRTWKIRPQSGGEAVGHEYWMADGVRLGYHGHNPASGSTTFGAIRYDNSQAIEAPFPHDSRHFHSHDLGLIVGDGRPAFPYILLWRFVEAESRFEGPRALCWHRGSSHVQQTHVHPRLTDDGRGVLFTSDASGYGNVYLAELAPFESLPTLDDVLTGPRRPWVPFGWLGK